MSDFFIISIDTQFVIQVILVFTSSYNYKDSINAIENIALVFVAVASAHTGKVIARKSGDNVVKFRFRSTFYGIATTLLVFAYII